MADIYATLAWQNTGALAVTTSFQNKGADIQIETTNPGVDNTQGAIVPYGRILTFASGTTVYYRSGNAATATPGGASPLRIPIAMISGY